MLNVFIGLLLPVLVRFYGTDIPFRQLCLGITLPTSSGGVDDGIVWAPLPACMYVCVRNAVRSHSHNQCKLVYQRF